MNRGRKPKDPIGITEEFKNEMSMLDSSAKKNMIARLEKEKQDAKDFLKEHPQVVNCRESLKEMTASPKETIRAVNNRQKYLVEELKNAGEFPNPYAHLAKPDTQAE